MSHLFAQIVTQFETNEVSIFKPIRDIVIMVVLLLRGVNLNIQKIDSDWLPKFKCHVIDQSEMLFEW